MENTSGLIGRRVNVSHCTSTCQFEYEGECLAYYPEPYGSDNRVMGMQLLLDNGKVQPVHIFPALTEFKIVIPPAIERCHHFWDTHSNPCLLRKGHEGMCLFSDWKVNEAYAKSRVKTSEGLFGKSMETNQCPNGISFLVKGGVDFARCQKNKGHAGLCCASLCFCP